MAYYNDLLAAYKDVDKAIQTSIRMNKEINVKAMLFYLTGKHPVSRRALLRRIEENIEFFHDALEYDKEQQIIKVKNQPLSEKEE